MIIDSPSWLYFSLETELYSQESVFVDQQEPVAPKNSQLGDVLNSVFCQSWTLFSSKKLWPLVIFAC